MTLEEIKADEDVVAFRDAVNNVGKKGESGRFSVGNGGYDYTKPFSEQIKDWKKGIIPKNDSLLVGTTPDILQNIRI